MFKGIAFGAVAMILVAVIVWLAFTYTGAYNVAATDTHADAVRWTLDTETGGRSRSSGEFFR